jgi:hypothetical protein
VCESGQRCDGTSCVCDSTSCANGCCDGTTCVPLASQTRLVCGHGGLACGSCNGMNGCITASGTCGPANILFASSAVYTSANFGGIAGADNDCRQMATAQGLPQPNSFMAYLSTSTTPASMRVQGARGWIRPNGTEIADTADDLTAGNLYYPPLFDESSNYVMSDLAVITGSDGKGHTMPGSTCGDWTASSGSSWGGFPYAGSFEWQSSFSVGCGSVPGTRFRLWCVQAIRNVSIVLPKPQTRIAFITTSGWTPSGGIAAADAKCQSDATDAGLAGSFRALLSTSTVAAVDRFAMNTPWMRPDGVIVFIHASDLSTMTMAAPITVAADGVTRIANAYVWSGSTAPNALGTAATTCNNWTSRSSTDSATAGLVGSLRTLDGSSVWGLGPVGCDFRASMLYCLQQ